MKKRFGIDIDGTVTCPASMIPFLNTSFQLNLTLEDIKQYDLMPLVNVSEEEFAEWFTTNEPVIYEESPMAEGAGEVLTKWKDEHELYFISARGSHLLEVTKKWFLDKELTFHHIELIGSHDKIAAAKKHNVDIFFEDKHDNAVMIHEQCGIPVLLFDTPYNRDPIPEGVIRVYNWQEAEDWVKNWLAADKVSR
ncbi:5' nucleotidase, NT5C type [Cytobacillus gottheilii]|uniref:5' nucleotidase, NT5C type n=1 Tax=Cytobacillus gottheilii TaxID=859144 RepID=UPI00082C6C12|nr:hypothetical protein [Cytobacillus gottheilii]